MYDVTRIDKFISQGLNDSYNIGNFYESIYTSDTSDSNNIIKIPISDFYIKHKDDLASIVQIIKLDEKYFYKPKSLSYDIYGTTEMWLGILRLNNMKNVTEFHMPVIKIYEPNALRELTNVFFKRERKI